MNSRDQFEQHFINTEFAGSVVAAGPALDYDPTSGYVYPAAAHAFGIWQASRACATPEWEHAPDWANWLAMDVEGRWYWFAEKPEQRSATWANGWATRVREAGLTPGRSGWTETLEQRP